METRYYKIVKSSVFIAMAILLAAACSTSKHVEGDNTRIEENDSTEYELIVLEVGFDPWYIMQNQPSKYRSIEYYKHWNIRYVSEWNYNVSRPWHSDIFRDLINYDANEEYPFELEHKLFYYFMFVENELKIPIITGGPRPRSY